MNYKLQLEYKGTNYKGWAIQPNGIITIHGTILFAIKKLFNIIPIINASGRTDAGVHAISQIINLKHTNLNISAETLLTAINSQLPYDILVRKCEIVDDKFHARFFAKSKIYVYKINQNELYNVFENDLIYQYNKKIDLIKVNEILNLLVGKKNFLSFSTSELQDTIREITKFEIKQNGDILEIEIYGVGFLRHMVRMIIGVILAFNENKIDYEFISDCLVTPRKGKAMYKAPACGLYLFDVKY